MTSSTVKRDRLVNADEIAIEKERNFLKTVVNLIILQIGI